MAIQTQGFQFQNLARYTPVDPTLVGVDFSRIGSGIADAMKLGASLQQYQMRKQAMEEEAATRESRIAQANAVARLAAARSQEAMKNVELMESTVAKQAEADRERASQILRSGILEFGPKADVERAKGVIALTPETTALTLAQTQADRAILPLVKEAQAVGLTRQIAAGRRGILTDEQVENMSMQQQLLGLAAGGLKLSREQAEIYNTEADTRLKAAQTLAATAGKARDPLPIVRELNDQIDALLKRPMVYEDGTVTNLQAYEGRMAAKERGEKEGIFGREIKADATLNKYLTELNQLRAIRDRYLQSAIGETGGGMGGARGGGLGGGGMAGVTPPSLGEIGGTVLSGTRGGGMAAVTPPSLGEIGVGSPALAEIANLAVTTPAAGVATAAPALATLFSEVEAAPATAPAAAQGPAATMEIKDGKVVPVKSVMERAEGATQKAIEFAKEKPASAILAAAAAKKVIPPVVKLSGSALKTLLSYTPEAIAGARTLASRATPALAANEILGSFIRTDEKPGEETGLEIGPFKTKFGAGSAAPRIARLVAQSMYEPEGSRQIQDEIEGISEEIKSISQSNLTAAEKLSQIRPLREQLGDLVQKANANAIKTKPRAKMINIPRDQVPIINIDESIGIPVERPEAKMINIPRDQVPVITIDESQGIPVQRPAAKMINIPEELAFEDLLSRIFYGKTLEERINSKFYSGR